MHEDVVKLLARRSIRSFTDQPVRDADIRDLLKAAMAAPSAAAKDPWHFVVVRNPSILARVAEQLPNGQMITKASVGVIVCGDLARAHRHQLSYLLQDCSAATENLLLAAAMMGLGACWLGIHPDKMRIEGVRRLFMLPPTIIPVAGIAIGYPAELLSPRTRFQETHVHQEIW